MATSGRSVCMGEHSAAESGMQADDTELPPELNMDNYDDEEGLDLLEALDNDEDEDAMDDDDDVAGALEVSD